MEKASLVLTSGKVPVKVWTDDIEESAKKQLVNMSELPFIHKHIAVMPDVHAGIGATIGSVIPTVGAIVPAAVGVDIGCFTGETKVELADGRKLSFLEIIDELNDGKELYCYSVDENGSVKIAKIDRCMMTRKTKTLAKVLLDNWEEIYSTPDHVFYKSNMDEIEAKDMKNGESLQPLYMGKAQTEIPIELLDTKYVSNDYTVVFDKSISKYRYAHYLADEYNARHGLAREMNTGWVRHHVDFTKHNNNPNNILRMSPQDHWKVHYENGNTGDSGFKRLHKLRPHMMSEMSSKNLKKLHNDPEFAKRRNARSLAQFQRMNANPTENMRKHRKEFGRLGGEKFSFQNKDPGSIMQKKLSRLKRIADECIKRFGQITPDNWEESRKVIYNGSKYDTAVTIIDQAGVEQLEDLCDEAKYQEAIDRHPINHQVLSVELIELDEEIPVYCLTTSEYSNFALASGVFVHNCGMLACLTSLTANNLDEKTLKTVYDQISRDVPVGHKHHDKVPVSSQVMYDNMFKVELDEILQKHPLIGHGSMTAMNWHKQLGSLGGGNHFIELCLDEADRVWIMLHSGSRGIGNAFGKYFIELAREDMRKWFINLPDIDLAYIPEGTEYFDDYRDAVYWAQKYADINRREMLRLITAAMVHHVPNFRIVDEVISCHHNYISHENHFGKNVYVTRKGAIRAREGDIGIIPGSMGAKSFIVRGKGNPESFCSCSHGAGRRMSRTQAGKQFTKDDLIQQTDGVMCRKDTGVIDEIPAAYKDIDVVMNNQSDLVDIVHTLKQIMCIKG